MNQRDMALLLEVQDELNKMDRVLEQLAGHGHASGDFVKLDNVYDVIQHNAHPSYMGSDEADEIFYHTVNDREKTPEERAEILLDGMQ